MNDLPRPLTLRDFKIYKGYLSADEQHAILTDVRTIVRDVPLFQPQTPYGKPMSVQMTSAGKYGWYADRSGYSYRKAHPNGSNWPDIPDSILKIWQTVGPKHRQPECCLINYYSENAKMGLHQDRDEADFQWPVVSISLGDDALFRIGNQSRGGSTESIWLKSGDVVVMEGDARLTYHGVDRIRFGSSQLLHNGGRINLTLRVVE
ncbi:alpha-ketoglutarate-dependent dioxygenase AlkB family protein [Pseudaestuariivita rosea]|uniref:alpha-ketoglutarate-dependent dioxygenase AlkB family protein n=1 Tax=Pseudaestuariivita rosea TaxID=2763263 RepID=UPI001ABA747F|nr:alpha-ketoglutarate-dependent dioxygenase AlkB [Pseudaestuariivita rosea]